MFMSYSILSIGTVSISHSSVNKKHFPLAFSNFLFAWGILGAANKNFFTFFGNDDEVSKLYQ